MVKRRYVKKKRSYKKRRMMKRSRRSVKRTNYDGVLYVKSAMVRNFNTGPTVGQSYAFMAISWGAIGATDNWNAYMDDA